MKLSTVKDVFTGRKKLTWSELAIPVLYMVYIIMRATDRVFYTRIGKILRSPVYNTVFSNIMFPVGLFICQLLVTLGYIAVQRFINNDSRYGLGFLLPRSEMACSTGSFPQYLLFVFIIGDQLQAILLGWGAPFTDQALQNMLTNFTLVFTVLFAFIFLKTRFHQVHYIACLLVIFSTLQAVTVEVQTGDPPLGYYRLGDGTYEKSSIIYPLMVFLGCIPLAGSNIFKQYVLKGGAKHGHLDIFYASLYSGFWQIILGLAMLPTMAIPFPGIEPISMSEIPNGIVDFFTCFFGSAPERASKQQQELCTLSTGSAFEWFLIYSVFSITFCILMLWLTKKMSSTWLQVGNCGVLTISSLMGTSKALMGASAKPLTFEEVVGLLLACISLWVYCLEDEIDASGKDVYLKTGGDGCEKPAAVDVEAATSVEQDAPVLNILNNDLSSSNVLLKHRHDTNNRQQAFGEAILGAADGEPLSEEHGMDHPLIVSFMALGSLSILWEYRQFVAPYRANYRPLFIPRKARFWKKHRHSEKVA